MPLYEFRCADCGLFEEWRSIADCGNPAHCPACTQAAKRIFSSQGLISLNGQLRLSKEPAEPKLVKRELAPKEQRVKNHAGGRPWMLTH
jgi:putative FmdB family regulatory protein